MRAIDLAQMSANRRSLRWNPACDCAQAERVAFPRAYLLKTSCPDVHAQAIHPLSLGRLGR